MNAFRTVNILDMIDALGEDAVKDILSEFSCSKNTEIEHFLKNNAIDFAKRKLSVTYLIFDLDGNLSAYFSLTHKALEIENKNLSASVRKKIERFTQPNDESDCYIVSAFLIAQFGKNDSERQLSGDSMMESAVKILSSVQHNVGGGIIYLECEDKESLLSFYRNNNFRIFGDRYSQKDQTKYIQLIRLF